VVGLWAESSRRPELCPVGVEFKVGASPTFAAYTTGMVKARLRKLVRRDDRSRPSADVRDLTDYTPPPKKPPAPSLKYPLKRGTFRTSDGVEFRSDRVKLELSLHSPYRVPEHFGCVLTKDRCGERAAVRYRLSGQMDRRPSQGG
jgi:hypothetical protein